MMIEDEELRGIYQTSSDERLQTLDAGLLHLEQHPEDLATVDGLMREAHSLKGDSNMLGLPEIGQVAHHLENILGRIKRAEEAFTPELGDRLSQGLAAMGEMIAAAVSGHPCSMTATQAIAQFDGVATESPAAAPPEQSAVPMELFGDDLELFDDLAPTPTADSDPEAATAAPDKSLQIADQQQRENFQIASEEWLQVLTAGLTHLTQQPDDTTTLTTLTQTTQALTQDSQRLGLTDLGTLVVQMNHQLQTLQRKEATFSTVMGEHLTHGLEAMRQLATQAITGIPAQVNVFYVLAELMGATVPPECLAGDRSPGYQTTDCTNSHPAPHQPVAIPTSPAYEPDDQAISQTTITAPETALDQPQSNEPIAAEEATASIDQASTYRIETIRVPTQNLDALMTQTGELTVTKIRVTHRLGEIEEISNLWEDWSRDVLANRFLLHEVQRSPQNLRQLEELHQRSEHYLEQLGTLVSRLRGALYEDTTRLDMISGELEDGIRTLRLLPLSTIFNLYPRLVRDLARQEKKIVNLVIEGADTCADKRILEDMKDPLLHMIRNAIDHGIEPPTERLRQGKPEAATIILKGYQTPTSIVIEVSDDGRGLNVEAIKQTALRKGLCRPEEVETMTAGQIQNLILRPGFSTRTMVTEVSGRGVGLDVLRTNVERLKGDIHVISEPGHGCKIRVQLGTTLATAHVLIVSVSKNTYAIPVEFVQTACLVTLDDIFTIEGRHTIIHDGQPISVVNLSELLELPHSTPSRSEAKSQSISCIILQTGADRLGIFVDALIDEQDVVLKPQSQLLKRVRNITGATILGTGDVCMVLNPQDLIQSVRHLGRRIDVAAEQPTPYAIDQRPANILLVEDSIATRTQEKRILEAAGYNVVTAVDGLDGFNKLQSHPFDAVISDVQMPNLDGLVLTQRIRQHREYSELPVILVTTLTSDLDRQRGAEAGANAYITKGSFNQEVLLDTLQRLI